MSHISSLQDRIKSQEFHIKNFKKSLQEITEKKTNYESLYIELETKNKKIQDLEDEINNLHVEIINYQESITNKNKVIDEFQNLVKMSSEKFKVFDDTNSEIIRDNKGLKNRIDELLNKIKEKEIYENDLNLDIEDLKKTIGQKDIDLARVHDEIKRNEEKYFTKLENLERNHKDKLSKETTNISEDCLRNIAKLNNEIEVLVIENEKIKLEKNNLSLKIEEYENIFKEKESEFKNILSYKDEEYDSLAKTINNLQLEFRELEANYRNKSEEFKLQINQLENNDDKRIYVINGKEKQIVGLKNDINNLNATIDDLNLQIDNLKTDVNNKESMNNKLNSDLNNFLNDLKLYEYKLRTNDENFEKERLDYLEKIRLIEIEKDNTYNEKRTLKDEINKLKKTISDMEAYYLGKKKEIEYETNSLIEKNSNDIIKTCKLKEEELHLDVQNLKNILADREKQKDEMAYKLEGKIYKQQVKIGELEARNNNLIRSLSTLKDMTLQIERNFLNKIDFLNTIRSNVRNNQSFVENDDPKFMKIRDNLKDMVSKLDYNLRNAGEMSNMNDSYLSHNYNYRSPGNMNESKYNLSRFDENN